MVQSEVIRDKSGRVYTIYGEDQADVDRVKKEVKAEKYVHESVQMFKNQRAAQELDAMASENNNLKDRLAKLEEALKKAEDGKKSSQGLDSEDSEQLGEVKKPSK